MPIGEFTRIADKAAEQAHNDMKDDFSTISVDNWVSDREIDQRDLESVVDSLSSGVVNMMLAGISPLRAIRAGVGASIQIGFEVGNARHEKEQDDS